MRHFTELGWAEIMSAFERNLEAILGLPNAEPMPEARFCRESLHLMLGHLTACQSAWLPIMSGLARGDDVIEVDHPVRLYRKTGLASASWDALMARFTSDRTEWRDLLNRTDPDCSIKTQTKAYTKRQLTRRLVLHEAAHLADHGL